MGSILHPAVAGVFLTALAIAHEAKMRMTRPFYIVDVFAERPYTGNQLAVVLDADDLPDIAMQAIAAEANYSESAFVASNPDHARSVSPAIRFSAPAGWSGIISGRAHPATYG